MLVLAYISLAVAGFLGGEGRERKALPVFEESAKEI